MPTSDPARGPVAVGSAPAPRVQRTTEEIETELLLEAILARYGYDFRAYSRGSIHRRVEHALEGFDCGTISELQSRILRDEAAFRKLLPSLAVSVTEMFREPGFFVGLRAEVIPYLRTYPSLRIWVAGCSTGEEVLSLCILLDEERLLERTLIYATDINPSSLEAARRGVYPLNNMAGYTRNYQAAGGIGSLSEYYVADYGSVLFHPRLLSNVVFADHSLATDAVFSEVHLVVCRNVLIYFEPVLQDRALGLFEDALCPRGFLGLGSRETLRLSRKALSFEPVVLEHRIYQKRLTPCL